MTFKAKSAKSTVTPLLTLGGQNVKSVNQYKYLGIVSDTELSDGKDIQIQLRYQYCAANKLRASFSCCSNAVKNVLLRSFCTPMYASQLWCKFRKSCMQRLHMAYNFGCRALYNLPWRASVSSHQVQYNILTFEALQWKTSTCFSKDSENLLTSCGYMVWCGRLFVFIPILWTLQSHFTLNEWSNIAVSVWLMACQVTMHSHFT